MIVQIIHTIFAAQSPGAMKIAHGIIAFKSLVSLLLALPDDTACRGYLERTLWRDGLPICPHCTSKKHYVLTNKGEHKGMYKCADCRKRYTVLIGTMFEGSHLPLRQWFVAIYLVSIHKKGISSHQLATDLGITQKSAWFVLHRIRAAFGLGESGPLGGGGQIVEVDETYPGGKVKGMNKAKRAKILSGEIEANDNKTVVMGFVERGGKLRMKHISSRSEIAHAVRENVEVDTVLITDTSNVYSTVGKQYAAHEKIDHAKEEFKRGYVYTNSIEGVFSLFDRMIIGIYHSISPKHTQAYCNEHAFRYNNRTESVNTRFDLALMHSRKLPYAVLIGKKK